MLEFLTNFLSTTIVRATPMLIAALGSLFIERSGIINIGIEGLMLVGALMGVIGSYFTGSAVAGACVAMLSAAAFGLIFAFFTITLKANHVVSGLAINAIASGFTILVRRLMFGLDGTVPKIATYQKIAIPVLSKLPVLGPTFFNQTALAYIALILVPVLTFVFKRTNIGLKVRSVGENPLACDTLGINVVRVRYLCMIFGAMMAGLGGSFISMGQMSFFSEGMIAGRGYMTLAAEVFGNYTPVGTFLACLVFGAADAAQYRLQAMSSAIPYHVWIMLPYLITVTALCVYRNKSNAPASQGQSYVRN